MQARLVITKKLVWELHENEYLLLSRILNPDHDHLDFLDKEDFELAQDLFNDLRNAVEGQ